MFVTTMYLNTNYQKVVRSQITELSPLCFKNFCQFLKNKFTVRTTLSMDVSQDVQDNNANETDGNSVYEHIDVVNVNDVLLPPHESLPLRTHKCVREQLK